MDESIKSLDEKKWIEAIHFLKEVESMEKWKEIYGSKIYANLGKFQKPIFYLLIQHLLSPSSETSPRLDTSWPSTRNSKVNTVRPILTKL